MRIAIDTRLPTYQMGGISQYVLHLLPALAQLDHNNQYTILHSRKEARDFAPDAPNFGRANVWTPCHHRWERWALSAELLLRRFDVLHSPDFIPPQWGAKRHIITVHDLNFLYYPQYLTAESRRYYNDQIAWAVARADAISADSEHTRQDLINRLSVPPEKVTTIHLAANPVYTRMYNEEEIGRTLTHHNLPHDFILFVGTLEPRKNIPTLIRAYYQMRQESAVDVPLVLVGRKGWHWEQIFDTIRELRLEDDVHHLEGVFDEQLAHLYHAAGVLALPSHYEGFGLPPLEAMHCHCPVVVSNRGSLPEIVGDAGLILEADDVEAWADALGRVLTDSALQDGMIVRGVAQSAQFDWQATAQATLDLYSGTPLLTATAFL